MRVSRKISIYRAQRSQQGCSLSLGMLRLAEPPTGRARLRSSLKSPRNPITPFETSRVSTLHLGLYKGLRKDARRVIGAIAKPLYTIGGKTEGFDRRVNPVGRRERNSFHRLRAVPLPRGGRSLGRGTGERASIVGRKRRVIGAIAKPLYTIGGKAGGLDRRTIR